MIIADPRVCLFERGRVEGRLAHQQSVQYAAQRPNIRLVAVRLLVQHFRRYVVWRAAYRPANTNDRLHVTMFRLMLCLDEHIC